MVESLLSGLGLHFLLGPKNKEEEFDISQFKNPDSYDLETRKIINMVTLEDNSNPVGSQKYKVHRYPGDIDIMERIQVCCSLEEATEVIVQKIQHTIKEIIAEPYYYLADFKAGIDKRFQVALDQPKPQLIQHLMTLRHRKLLTSGEVGSMISLLKKGQIEELKEALRKYSVIRWKTKELLTGQKQLIGGVTITLKEAITHPTIVKLDLWAPIRGNYTEITNFLLLVYTDQHGRNHPVNVALADRISSLISDIKMYSKAPHKKSLKVAKRMWALAQGINDQATIKKLYPLFSSDPAVLSQITSEIETLTTMMTRLETPPWNLMITQIDHFKTRMGNLTIKLDESRVFDDINVITKMYTKYGDTIDRDLVIQILKRISSYLSQIIETYSSDFLDRQGLLNAEYYDYLLTPT